MKHIKKAAFITLALPIIFVLSWICGALLNVKAAFALAALLIAIMVVKNFEDSFDLLEKNPDFDLEFSENDSGNVTAYIINLDSAKERLKYIQDQIKKLPIPHKRIAGIDGNKLRSKKNIVDIESYKTLFKMLPEPGTIGCFLSHEKAWRAFLASDNEFALILEDDVSFDPEELHETVSSLMKQKKLWDIVGLELLHDGSPVKLSTLSMKKNLCIYLTQVTHAGAYLINRKAAFALLEKMYPIKMPIDHYFTMSWELGTRFCGVEPRIVHQTFGDSQIKVDPPKKLTDMEMVGDNRLLKHIFYLVYSSGMKTLHNVYTYVTFSV